MLGKHSYMLQVPLISLIKYCQVWHSDFLDSFPTGLVNQEDFISLHQQLLPSGDPSIFCEHTFRTFDCNGDGRIDFR